MSSCVPKTPTSDTDEGQTIDEIIIQPDIQEPTSEDVIEVVDEPAVVNISADTWYSADRTELGPAFVSIEGDSSADYDWCYYYPVREFGTVYTGTDDADRMYICETVSESGSINITVKDTVSGDDIGVIDASSVVNTGDWYDYYTFVLDGTPYLEVDSVNTNWEISSVEFYELNPDTMTVGEQVDLFHEQDLAIISATSLPDGICLHTKEGRNYSEEYIRIYDDNGIEINSSSINDVFGNNCDEYYVQTIIPWGEDSVFISAIMCDDNFGLCSTNYYYGDSFAVELLPLPVDLYLERFHVTPEGEIYTISDTGIYKLNEYGELELYIDFNNVCDSVSGLRDAYIASVNDDGSVSLIGLDYLFNGEGYSYDIELDISANNYEDRTPIVIGVSDMNLDNTYYPDMIAEFNANNSEYYARLVVIETAPVYEVNEDNVGLEYIEDGQLSYYEYAVNDDNHIIEELNSDEAPDIYLSSGIENNIISSGALMDISSYVNEYLSENDGEYFDNVILAAANRNGEMYQVPLKFYISGVFAGDGSRDGITIEDSDFNTFEEMIENDWHGDNPISSWIGDNNYSIELIETHMNYYFNGENYDEDALIQLFDYLANATNGNSNDYYGTFYYQSIFSVLDLYYYTLIDFENLDTYVTVPGPEDTNFGAVAGALNTLSIADNTDQLEGAIAFLEFALSYDAQMLGSLSYGMSVNRMAYEDTNDELEIVCTDEVPEVNPAEVEQFLLDLIESVDSNSFYVVDTRLGAILEDIYYNQAGRDSSELAAEVIARYQS